MLGLKAHQKDNVATIFKEVKAGEMVQVKDPQGNESMIKANQDIPYGHKIALAPIEIGEAILKYGEALGNATAKIEVGDHVHVHNLNSARGRGDMHD